MIDLAKFHLYTNKESLGASVLNLFLLSLSLLYAALSTKTGLSEVKAIRGLVLVLALASASATASSYIRTSLKKSDNSTVFTIGFWSF